MVQDKILFERRTAIAIAWLTLVLLPALVHAVDFVPEDETAVPDAVGTPNTLSEILALLPPGARAAGTSAAAEGTAREQVLGVVRSEAPPEWLEVEYTTDPTLDTRLREIMLERGVAQGHTIVMDPRTGEVFSYVSTDPAEFPATGVYPTASLMKIVTAGAVLRHRPDAAKRKCRYRGSPYYLTRANLSAPTVGNHLDSFNRALAISNNQCFARFAVNDLGKEVLVAEMKRLGMFESPASRHSEGRLEPIDDALALGNLGSGLGGSFISPLAGIRLAAVLAEGELVQPFWIARIRDARGMPVAIPGRAGPRAVWPQGIADRIRQEMISVTTEGTAKGAFLTRRGEPLLQEVSVSGKTGTLSGTDPEGLYQWFIGVAPADDPRVAIATVVLNGESKKSRATKVAAAALQEILCRDGECEAANAERLHERALRREALAADEARQIALAADMSLDATPRPLGSRKIKLPRRLLRRKVSGRIVLRLELDPAGQVLSAQIDSSDLPAFEDFIVSQVERWQFTPPTRRGKPVHAEALVPIPIEVN